MYLITGGSGFFGTHLAKYLLDAGEKVRILDLVPPPPEDARAEFSPGDILDEKSLRQAISGVDVVVHNAALVPITRAGNRFYEVNVKGTERVIAAAKAAGVKKIIYISSSSVYGAHDGSIGETTPQNPIDDYGKSKAEGEKICRREKEFIDISIVRPRTILGEGRMGILGLLFDWVKNNRPVYILGSGDNRFQLISARDLASAVFAVSKKSPAGEDYNIGTDKFGTLKGDLREFIKKAGSRSGFRHVPSGLARAVLPVLDALRLAPLVRYHYNVADKNVYFDISKAKRLLGWQPEDSNVDMLSAAYNWFVSSGARGGSVHGRPVKQGILWFLKHLP